jgi:hypothetical protein
MDALGARHLGERSEGELIAAFVDKLGQLGNSFGNCNCRIL